MIPGQPTETVGGVELTTYTLPFSSKLKLHLVSNKAEWDAVFQLLMQQKYLCCDTETEGFQYYKTHRICGISFGWEHTHFYIPVRHKASIQDPTVYEQLSMDDIRSDLQKLFSRPDLFTIWHNWKFDSHFYRADGIEIKCKYHDTRLLWQIYDENAPGALKVIASGWKDPVMGLWNRGLVHRDANKWEGELSEWRDAEAKLRRKAFSAAVMSKTDELMKEVEFQGWKRPQVKKHIRENVLHEHPYKEAKKDDVDYSYIPIPLMTKYAALDTYLTWVVYAFCMNKIEWNRKLTALYVNEVKLSRALMEAEHHGVRIDRQHLLNLQERYTKKIKELSRKVFIALGYDHLTDPKYEDFQKEQHPFNLGSNEQLGKKLIEHGVKLTKRGDPTKRFPEGQLKVDAKVLKKFEKKHEVVKLILELRKYDKLLGTYVLGILDKLTDDDVLHCSFNQNVKTGRMSSQDPNLQNIPGRGEGEEIRRAFICWNTDYVYVLADYSQVEVRLTAHYSGDPLLVNSYLTGEDVHLRTACEMFGVPFDEGVAIYSDENNPRYKEIKALRNIAKIINFGIIYGVGAPGLSEQIARPDKYKDSSDEDWIEACQEFIDAYLEKYEGVRRFVSRNIREIKRTAQAVNYFGRIRRLPHARACEILGDRSFFWLEARAGRQGVNFLIQGTAADVFKIAVVRLFSRLKGMKSVIVNFVHDEVQMYIHKSELHILHELKRLMEDFDFSVPLISEFSWTEKSWADKVGMH